MSETHGALLARFFECWKNSDLDGALAMVEEDAVFEPDLKGTRHQGKNDLRVLWGTYMDLMQSYHCEIVSVLESDRQAMVERVEVIGSSKGVEMRLPLVGVFAISKAGRIASWRDYWDTSMAPAH
ncbi:MAG TPA: nuclear transport factor 2 family protein [Sphingobium sp.]|uniref:nuclear transport factor 2 family protein n=1 Tax=Sphingobium sp. TaxID=1912891 RepID=UPI002ED66F81